MRIFMLSFCFLPMALAGQSTGTNRPASRAESASTPVITWTKPAEIVYGMALSSTQLDAASSVAGTFVYTPSFGAVLNAGSQTLLATFTPTDTTDYTTKTASVEITVKKATPTITWAAPAAIIYGTPLNAIQLNATSTTAGTFVYNHDSGVVLRPGTHSLLATFTPTDTVDYTTAKDTVSLAVGRPGSPITWATPAAITYGTALGLTQLDAT